jgi:threonylcarbamoyladenosine tRNA methylthiotransferase MtaB
MQVHLKTLGCRLNEAELENWAQGFQRQGHRITREQHQADLIILNSCAVTEEAVRKSRQSLRRIHRDNPRAKLVVSGCYATLHHDEAAQLIGVDLVVDNQNKDRLVEIALRELNLDAMPIMAEEPGDVALFSRGRQRAFVKVQDGCRYRCTFCIVTEARGEEKSRPIADIVAEIDSLCQRGVQEAIITGVHLGGYGLDSGTHLGELIRAILEQTAIPRLRLGSLEPWDLPEGFFRLFENPRLMPHLHLPLQSGSDNVLRRMARRCKTQEFAAIAAEARARIPDLNLTTDIIVGFPGETEQEWEETLAFVERIAFGHIHIFSYSPRAGTKAATLPNQVPDVLKKNRSRELHVLAAKLRQQSFNAYLGREFAVLWEGHAQLLENGLQRVYGYTPNYLRIATETASLQMLENRILPVRLTRPTHEYICAEATA